MTPLRIALVGPPWYPIPPVGYGGMERVVHLLAAGLGERGHHVTVIGAEGSTTGDEVRERAPRAWATDLGTWVHKHTYLARVYRELLDEAPFDVIHDHTGTEGILVAALVDAGSAMVATTHEPVGAPEAAFLAEVEDRVDLVAVSRAQAAGGPGVRWAAVVHNALDPDELVDPGSVPKDGYLVQLARVDRSKGQHLAIAAARRAGLPLVLAGKVDAIPECEAYFRDEVEPHLGDGVTWLPEVRGRDKGRLLAGATAMVFPIGWEEPFGLAMVEAMANGTPVIAFPRGAAPELVRPGLGGVLVDDVEGMAAAVPVAAALDPAACAADARARWAPGPMVAAYEAVYRAALHRRRPRAVHA